MQKILIVDDHPVVRRGLKQIITGAYKDIIIDEAGNGREALNKVRKNDYDLVFLDISLPDLHGLDVLKQLKSENPILKILVVSIHPENQYALRVLRSGASGYLAKDAAPDELIVAIDKILSGKKYISLSVAENLASSVGTNAEKLPHEALSDREFQVACLIASGKMSKIIAEELSLSIKTVSTYRNRILKKLDMKSNAELILYGVQNNLLG